MEGITILNTIIVPNMIIGAFAIAGLIALLLGIFIYLKDDETFGSITMAIGVLMFIIFGMFFLGSEKKTRYEVIIDENVKFNEFMEHYKVIEQHGQIYIIEELDRSSSILIEG